MSDYKKGQEEVKKKIDNKRKRDSVGAGSDNTESSTSARNQKEFKAVFDKEGKKSTPKKKKVCTEKNKWSTRANAYRKTTSCEWK